MYSLETVYEQESFGFYALEIVFFFSEQSAREPRLEEKNETKSYTLSGVYCNKMVKITRLSSTTRANYVQLGVPQLFSISSFVCGRIEDGCI